MQTSIYVDRMIWHRAVAQVKHWLLKCYRTKDDDKEERNFDMHGFSVIHTHIVAREQGRSKNCSNPLSPNTDPHANSSNLFPFISLKNWLEEFNKRSNNRFPFGDHSINSYLLFSWLCIDIVWRKVMSVTAGTWRVFIPIPLESYYF